MVLQLQEHVDVIDCHVFLVSLQLLPNLYHLGSASREEVNSLSVGPIQEKLESMAGEVTNVMDQQLQVTFRKTYCLSTYSGPYALYISSLSDSAGVNGGYSRVSVSSRNEEE